MSHRRLNFKRKKTGFRLSPLAYEAMKRDDDGTGTPVCPQAEKTLSRGETLSQTEIELYFQFKMFVKVP